MSESIDFNFEFVRARHFTKNNFKVRMFCSIRVDFYLVVEISGGKDIFFMRQFDSLYLSVK